MKYPKVYPNEQSVQAGSNATFVCYYDGDDVTWKYQGGELPPGTQQVNQLNQMSRLIIEQVTANTVGVYTCEYEEEDDQIRLYDVAKLVLWSHPYEFTHDTISMADVTRKNFLVTMYFLITVRL